jgi:predicted phosphodiesterase
VARVGIIGDVHLPYHNRDYLQFCKDVFDRNGVTHVVQIGDLIDNHSISFHESDPDLPGPSMEMKLVDRYLEDMGQLFPKMYVLQGNHEERIMRKMKSAGLPSRFLKAYQEVFQFPKEWIFGDEFTIDGVDYIHGTGFSGVNGHRHAAVERGCPTVMGHLHGTAGIAVFQRPKDLIWGMNVGCGVDAKSLAMAYGKYSRKKPILSCGLVIERRPQLVLMEVENGSKESGS